MNNIIYSPFARLRFEILPFSEELELLAHLKVAFFTFPKELEPAVTKKW